MKPKSVSLKYMFFAFLKIGASSFGGYMALITAVRELFVDKYKLVEDKIVLDGISLSSVLPGPVAVNVVTFIGFHLRGIPGAIISAIAVVIPSFVLILILSVLYFEYSESSALNYITVGVLPTVLAIIVATAIKMAKKNIENSFQFVLMASSFGVLIFFNGYTVILFVIGIAGLLGVINYLFHNPGSFNKTSVKLNYAKWYKALSILAVSILLFVFLELSSGASNYGEYQKLFFTFSSISLTLFGGGYVFIPIIQETVVNSQQWLTQKEFADAIAMGQVTPGPILISAAVIGYKVKGVLGALVSTVAIFAPSGVLMIYLSKVLLKHRNNHFVVNAMSAIRAATIGLIFASSIAIGKEIQLEYISLGIFLIILIAFLKFRISVFYLIPSGIILGIFYQIIIESGV